MGSPGEGTRSDLHGIRGGRMDQGPGGRGTEAAGGRRDFGRGAQSTDFGVKDRPGPFRGCPAFIVLRIFLYFVKIKFFFFDHIFFTMAKVFYIAEIHLTINIKQ